MSYREGEERGPQAAARDELKAASQEAVAGARTAGREGKRRAQGFLEHQREAAADGIDELALALGSTARQLELEERMSGPWTRRAAEGAEQVASALRSGNVGEIRQRAETFGRSNPGALFAGAVVAGLLLSRFLKSTSPDGGESATYDGEEEEEEEEEEYPYPEAAHGGAAETASHATGPAAGRS